MSTVVMERGGYKPLTRHSVTRAEEHLFIPLRTREKSTVAPTRVVQRGAVADDLDVPGTYVYVRLPEPYGPGLVSPELASPEVDRLAAEIAGRLQATGQAERLFIAE